MKPARTRFVSLLWLLAALLWLPVAAYIDFSIVNLAFPLAQREGGLIYYPTEDQVGLPSIFNGYSSNCDADHRQDGVVVLEPPVNFKKLPNIGILTICNSKATRDRWNANIRTDQQVRDALDHIEAIALRRDFLIIGALGSIAGLPVLMCLGAFVIAIIKSRRPPHASLG